MAPVATIVSRMSFSVWPDSIDRDEPFPLGPLAICRIDVSIARNRQAVASRGKISKFKSAVSACSCREVLRLVAAAELDNRICNRLRRSGAKNDPFNSRRLSLDEKSRNKDSGEAHG